MGSSTRRTSLCPVTGSRLSTGRWLERAPGSSTWPPTVGSIRHVVIIVKENHSFDNYFGSLQSPPLSLPHCTSLVAQVNCQYDGSDIPAYYAYARNFGYADTYFTDVRGPSWPNDMM